MERLIRLLQRPVQRRPGLVLLAFALATCTAAVPASWVRVDTSLENFMASDDPDRLRNREIKQQFSNDEILVIAFDLGRPYAAGDLVELNALSRAIAGIDGVEEVFDLSTIEDVRASGDFLDASPLVDLANVHAEIDAVRARARGHRLYRQNLVSEDGHVLAVMALLELRERADQTNPRVSAEVLALIDGLDVPWDAYVSGYPFSEYDGNRIFTRDLGLLSGAAFLLVLGVVYLLTRRGFPLLLVTAEVVWAELVCMAWFGITDTPLTVVSAVCPPILLASACTYVIYLLGLLPEASRSEQVGPALVECLARPALLAAVSTAIGFLSLRLMPVDVIGQLGTGLSVGIVAACLGSLLMLPAAVQRFGWRLEERPLPFVDRLAGLGVRLAARPVATTLGALGLAAVAATGISRLELESDPLLYWQPESYHRRSAEFVRDHLSGTLPANLIVHGRSVDGALDPELLGFTDALLREVEAMPSVDRTLSFLDYLWLMDAALRPGAEPATVPPSAEAAAQYMLLYEAGGDPGDYRHYIDHDRSTLNAWVRLNERRGGAMLELRERVLTFAAGAPEGVRVEVLGSELLFARAMDAIARGMAQGLGLALALITGVLVVSLRSLKLALVAAIPNALPIAVCTGLMGWLGVPFSFGTSIVGCVALGLAVDDTAHVLGHLRPGRTLEEVYASVGRALVQTSLVLGCGFGVLCFGEFVPTIHLGAATTLTLLLALAADLLLLPSLLVLLGWPLRREAPRAAWVGRLAEASS